MVFPWGKRNEESIPTPVLGTASSKVQWVVTFKSERNSSSSDRPQQLRAEPAVIHISPRVVIDTQLGHWLRHYKVRYVAFLFCALQIILLVKTPDSDPLYSMFDGQEHFMWRRRGIWHILDGFLSIMMLLLLLHYTNRDLIQRQLWSFDSIVIVGNYFWWFLTRAFSEYSIFNEHFGPDRFIAHFLDAATALPLIVVAACFDSVKMSQRTKIVIIMAMVCERCYQYIKFRESGGVFADHGKCPLFGIEFECANLQGTHLSSNMTVIVFFLKSVKAYMMGEHFAVVKPKFKIMVRKDDNVLNGDKLFEESSSGLEAGVSSKELKYMEESQNPSGLVEKKDRGKSTSPEDSQAAHACLKTDFKQDQAFEGTTVFDCGFTMRPSMSPPSSPTPSVKEVMKIVSAKHGTDDPWQQNARPEAAEAHGVQTVGSRPPSSGADVTDAVEVSVIPVPGAETEETSCEGPSTTADHAEGNEKEAQAAPVRESLEAEAVRSQEWSDSEAPSFGHDAPPQAHIPPTMHVKMRGREESVVPKRAEPFGPQRLGRSSEEESNGSDDSPHDFASMVKARDNMKRQIDASKRDLGMLQAQLTHLEAQVYQFKNLAPVHRSNAFGKGSRSSSTSQGKASTIYEQAFA